MFVDQDRADLPADAVDRVRKAQMSRYQAEDTEIRTKKAALLERFKAEKLKVIPAEVGRKLNEHAAGIRVADGVTLSKSERIRRRELNLAYAADQGVDLAALARLRADFSQQFQALHMAHLGIGTQNRVVVPDLQEPRQPRTAQWWNATWDAGYRWYSTRSSQFAIWNAESYYDPSTNRTGSHIRFRQRETDNDDEAGMRWANGYMVFYTMPRTARIHVGVFLTCDFSRFFVDCDNEPSLVSECNVLLQQWVEAWIYSNWSDVDPLEETSGSELTRHYATDPEEWHDDIAVFPNESRWAHLYSRNVYPAGQTLAVYINQGSYISALLDDTRVTAGVNSAWFMNNAYLEPVD